MKRTTLSPFSIRRVAFVCVLLLMSFEAWVIHVNYANYFAYVVDSESRFFTLVTVACLIASFLLLFNFIRFSLSAGWFYKVLSFAIFTLSLGIEYGYLKAIGRVTNLTDIETAIETTADQKVTSVLMYLNFYALIPIGVFLILLILIESEKKEGLKQFVIVNALTIALFAICPTLIDQPFPTLAVPAFYRTSTDLLFKGAAFSVLASNPTEANRRRTVKKPSLAPDFRPSNNIVIVIDESVRGDHLSVNGYGRDTTPFLQKLAAQGVLTNWGLAVSASTGSRFTYNALIPGLTPDDFPDKTELKTSTFPTIFQYAKAMNYTTYFFDGQMNSYWGGNGDDKNFLDSWEGPTLISEGMTFDHGT